MTSTATPETEKAPLFGDDEKRVVLDPLWDNNPIATQMLGICSALAVTTGLQVSIVMGISVICVMAMANVVISLLRNLIPSKIRIIVQLVVVSGAVIIVDQVLRAYAFDLAKQLGVFISLIITNCIVMGRLEAFAMGNPPWRSLLDGVANGLGYAWIICVVGAVREVFGAGKLMGVQVIPDSLYEAGYVNNGLMVLAPGAFLLLGVIVWVQRAIMGKVEE
ncbi:MAG: NADH:ubiquinone reductase (Na(+)-transporting) subunit D [Planctomycetota bacterium]|jgi:Na+-transporting NADH:ubiquinone oxidoreductase subunit D|nr:NADH:ubiquinone reductase (Na(+)-transporting) subunit D [Planctomycetota bacterium]MEC8652973.1 NADH:ubiquinone reductase (Na(+)-transporting) subunit D [Planctomycetota bacterium]MEC9047553.1 NADH:ubiquinone reductase (Na(+)-transporting) subunit D [Planctomycetota bacterium]